ncbi:hypothetical protein [Chondromyces crocatus]|uniref:Uncharacterized protein n=1 Tax=Chondromyces crocatus TaxID=52 RepID=A0A0K1EAM6_CHOCO|nr:hypothetical protein [Chondromyces crocatus]AKT37936.1 uncharacterized protein CMC5_020790 [Chondromyces crocatus]
MPATLAIPVSALEEEWFVRTFYAALDRAIEAPQMLWIVVDHSNEGDILLQCYRQARPRRRVLELRVEETDPAMVWTDLVGTADELGALTTLGDSEAVFLYGGALLHHELLRPWKSGLEALSAGWRRAVVAPIHRRTVSALPDLVKPAAGCSSIEVPEFRNTSRAVRVALAHDLVREAWPDPAPADVAELLIERDPASRTELQRWVEHCAVVAESAAGASVPPSTFSSFPRVHSFPRPIRSKTSLAAKFEMIKADIAETDRAYADWRNEPLFSPVQDAIAPFASHDPRSWFVTAVSYAACQYFDAAAPVVFRLSELIVGDDGLLRFDREPGFFRDLRALRTYFQHGLDLSSDKNRLTYNTVIAWFRDRCEADDPGREHWRALSASFLDSWQDVTRRMTHIARRALDAPNREHVARELDKESGRLPEWRWRQIVQAAAEDLGLATDAGAFLRSHLQEMGEALRKTAPSKDAIESAARRLAEVWLIKIADMAPVNGSDFIARGLTPGPRVGAALRLARELWPKDRSMSKAELISLVLEKLGPA